MPYSIVEGPFYNYYFSFESIISNDLIHDTALALDFTTQILKTWLLDSARFFVAITTVYSASKIHTSRPGSTCDLRTLIEHVYNAMAITKYLSGTILTFLLMIVFSDYFLDVATYWGGSGPLVWSRTLFFQIVHGITYARVMVIWSQHTALWHIGVVISILAEKRAGFDAFSASASLMRGNWKRGTMLKVLHLVWLVSLKFPTLFPRWGFYDGVSYKVVEAYLVCVGMIVSWVVYYYDCKNRQRGNKNMIVEEREYI